MQKKPGFEEHIEKDECQGENAKAECGVINPDASANPDPWQPVLCKLPVSLAYAAVIDVRNAEREITDQMVSQACREMETMQQFPFAPKSTAALK